MTAKLQGVALQWAVFAALVATEIVLGARLLLGATDTGLLVGAITVVAALLVVTLRVFDLSALVVGTGGFRAELNSVKERIEETSKKVEEQQKLINKLVETSMSPSVFRHLAGITILREYKYWQNEKVGELFQREFYYLKIRGFIGPETLEFFETMNDTNIAEKARPTDIGKIYITLCKDDVPKEWLSTDPDKRKNLKIDVARDLGLEVPEIVGGRGNS
jgi:hypothetical protein